MRGVFVTGTDTGVGKTVVAASIAATLSARGERVAAFKPVVTGLDDPGPWDHAVLARAARVDPESVTPWLFGPPVSPHLAASMAGEEVGFEELLQFARSCCADASVLIAEGVGGLLVPLTQGRTVRDLVASLGLPIVIAARPGLGTINHTLLTIESARSAGLHVTAVVLTPWPARPDAMHRSNAATIARLGEVAVATLRYVPDMRPRTLERAGAELPLARWLAPGAAAGPRRSLAA